MGAFGDQATTNWTLIISECWSLLIVRLAIGDQFWSALGERQTYPLCDSNANDDSKNTLKMIL